MNERIRELEAEVRLLMAEKELLTVERDALLRQYTDLGERFVRAEAALRGDPEGSLDSYEMAPKPDDDSPLEGVGPASD